MMKSRLLLALNVRRRRQRASMLGDAACRGTPGAPGAPHPTAHPLPCSAVRANERPLSPLEEMRANCRGAARVERVAAAATCGPAGRCGAACHVGPPAHPRALLRAHAVCVARRCWRADSAPGDQPGRRVQGYLG